MNIPLMLVSGIFFVVMARLSYEVWFLPEKFYERLSSHRDWLQNVLGFSYWTDNRPNLIVAKLASLLLLGLAVLAFIISIIGPISY